MEPPTKKTTSKPLGKPLSRKPSLKNKKPPEIKHTLTSKNRLLKANPLLELDEDRLKELGMTPGATHSLGPSVSSMSEKPNSLKVNLKPMSQRPKIVLNNGRNYFNNQSEIGSNVSVIKKTTRDDPSKKIDFVKRNIQASANAQRNVKAGVNLKRSQSTKPPTRPQKTNKNPQRENNPIRRSISSQHIERKKDNKQLDPKSCYSFKQFTKSFEDLRPTSNNMLQIPQVSPVIEEIAFKTPSAYLRRSGVFKTPNTISSVNNRRSLFLGMTSTPAAPRDLETRLNDWLKKRGKSLSAFHHLKCFGVHEKSRKPEIIYEPKDEENKENVEVDIPDDDSYKNLKITTPEDRDELKPEDTAKVAKEALVDLLKLIREGYAREQCECWLSLIRHKYNALEQEPGYWECRAAIEQSRGNITSAVDCYKTAIVQGAEIKSVDEALDQLLQKFSLLNISTDRDESESKDRVRIVQDARNVFKSSIIQFAVQERKSKNDVKKLIATPVRRSTRLSLSKYSTTPGVTLYASLQDIDSPTRKMVDFRQNTALN